MTRVPADERVGRAADRVLRGITEVVDPHPSEHSARFRRRLLGQAMRQPAGLAPEGRFPARTSFLRLHTPLYKDPVSSCTTKRAFPCQLRRQSPARSEEHTSELQSLMRISYAVFCLQKKQKPKHKLQQDKLTV